MKLNYKSGGIMENIKSRILRKISCQSIIKTSTGGFKVIESRSKMISLLVKNGIDRTPAFIEKLKNMLFSELQAKVMNEVFGVKFNSNVEIFK